MRNIAYDVKIPLLHVDRKGEGNTNRHFLKEALWQFAKSGLNIAEIAWEGEWKNAWVCTSTVKKTLKGPHCQPWGNSITAFTMEGRTYIRRKKGDI